MNAVVAGGDRDGSVVDLYHGGRIHAVTVTCDGDRAICNINKALVAVVGVFTVNAILAGGKCERTIRDPDGVLAA